MMLGLSYFIRLRLRWKDNFRLDFKIVVAEGKKKLPVLCKMECTFGFHKTRRIT
jgi:hypothetical protein